MSGILQREKWDQLAAARLLRELAAELRTAEGVTRNALFLELHRLQDTLFRIALERHPDAPIELAARAFAVENKLPASQVLDELLTLGTPWMTREIRQQYRHMNAVRNNMAHSTELGRNVVSRRNCKAMARLATVVADAVDPEQRGMPALGDSPEAVSVRPSARWPWVVGGLLLGVVVGLLLQVSDLAMLVGLLLATLVVGGVYLLDRA